MNKTIVLFMVFFCINFTVFSQSKSEHPSVEKSIFGIQAGLFGAYVYSENKLSDEIALRAEVGMLMGLWGGSVYPKTGYIFTPTLSLEPRYYYNFKRRLKNGKSIENNQGNYWSLKVNFNPDLFVISNYENSRVSNHITIVPSYGLRRTFGKHFEYEFTTGLGYVYDVELKKGASYLGLGFRIGYRF